MAQINVTGYRVDIVEHERGWGSKIVNTVYFDNEEEARQHVLMYNSSNTSKEVPDWYMIAEYRGKI